jgi:hypothetical protein
VNHKDLVKRAERWLHAQGCGFVLLELTTYASGIPDAIGFRSDSSILVECKTSRSDFRRDRFKAHHGPTTGMGDWRFYLTPAGLVKPAELPEHWGLLEVSADDGFVRRVAGGPAGRRNWYNVQRGINDPEMVLARKRDEMRMLYSALRRLKLRGVLDQIYDSPWKLPAPSNETRTAAA